MPGMTDTRPDVSGHVNALLLTAAIGLVVGAVGILLTSFSPYAIAFLPLAMIVTVIGGLAFVGYHLAAILAKR